MSQLWAPPPTLPPDRPWGAEDHNNDHVGAVDLLPQVLHFYLFSFESATEDTEETYVRNSCDGTLSDTTPSQP